MDSSVVHYVEISPPKHQKNNAEVQDDIDALVLAPFNPVPKIVFANIKINTVCQRRIIVKNPSNCPISVTLTRLPPKERCLTFNFTEANLQAKEEILLEITWTPKEAGSWKETIPVRTSSKFKTDIAIICNTVVPLLSKNRKKVSTLRTPTRPTVVAKKLVPPKSYRRPTVSGSTLHREVRGIRLPVGSGASPCRRQTFLVNSEDKENSPTPSIVAKQIKKRELNLTSRFENFVLSPAVPLSSKENVHHSVLDGFVMSPIVLPKCSDPPMISVDAVDGDASSFRHSRSPLCHHQDNLPSPTLRRTTFAVSARQACTENSYPKPGLEQTEEVLYDSLEETVQPSTCGSQYHEPTVSMGVEPPSIVVRTPPGDDIIYQYSTFIGSEEKFMESTIVFDLPPPSESSKRTSTGNKNSDNFVPNYGSKNICKDLFPQTVNRDVASPHAECSDSGAMIMDPRGSGGISHDRLSTGTYVKDRLSTGTYVKEQHSRDSLCSSGDFNEKYDTSLNHLSGSAKGIGVSPVSHLLAIQEEVVAPLKPCSFVFSVSPPNREPPNTQGAPSKCVSTLPAPRSSSPKPARRLVRAPPSVKRSMLGSSPVKHAPKKPDTVSKVSGVPATPIMGPLKNKTAIRKSAKFPGVAQTSLVLSKPPLRSSLKVAKRQERESEILYNTDDIFFSVKRVDLFAHSTDRDPFLNDALYLDEEWLGRQEKDMIKWLNALLTPPVELDAKNDLPTVDVADLWQKTCRQKDVGLAPSREDMSSDVYGKQHRLASLRKAAVALLRTTQVADVLLKVSVHVDKKLLVVRDDKDLHLDVGLQYVVLELLLCFNPLWLRIGLEAVYGRTVSLKNNSDVLGLATFIMRNMLHDDYITSQFSHPTVPHLKLPGFQDAMKKFTLKKFLFLVYFLDRAKTEKLISHDPCLFLRSAKYKETREILVAFARDLLAGVGDINRHLGLLGYRLSVKQTYIDEYEYGVKSLLDLRDGVRLTRVMEIILGTTGLTSKLRVPAVSKLQKCHNADVAFQALQRAGFKICGDITAKHIVEGHREKTMSFLWQIIYKFQAPLFINAATVLQRWWRKRQLPREIERRIRKRRMERRLAGAITIQAAWRGCLARRKVARLRERRVQLLARQGAAALVIQKHWRRHAAEKMLSCARRAANKIAEWYRGAVHTRRLRAEFVLQRASTVKIQAAWRGFMCRKRFAHLKRTAAALTILIWFRRRLFARRVEAVLPLARTWELQRRKRVAACVTIQARWRAQISMRRDRARYVALRAAALKVQRLLRAREERAQFLLLRSAAVTIQQRWRAQRAMRQHRQHFLSQREAAVTIQKYTRGFIARKKILAVKSAALVFQRRYRARLAMKQDRIDFLQKRMAARKIQLFFRGWLQMKRDHRLYQTMRAVAIAAQRHFRSRIAHMMNQRHAVVTLQSMFRAHIAMKRQRAAYLALKESAVTLQAAFRMCRARRAFLAVRGAALTLQRRFRAQKLMRAQRACYLEKRRAALVLQQRWRALIAMRTSRERLLVLRRAAMTIQSRWRAVIAMRESRRAYTALRSATVIIQRRWRATLSGRQVRAEWVRQQRAAVVLQRLWRTHHDRAAYLRLRKAAISVQTRWRGKLAVRAQASAFHATRAATITIQTRWRATILMRRHRNQFLELREAVVVLQSWWRVRRDRRAFRELKKTVVFVQRRWRAKKEGMIAQVELGRVEAAALTIQRHWRALLLTRLESERYRRIRSAVLAVQRWWRSILAARVERDRFLMLKEAAIVLQRCWRARRLARRTRAEVECMELAASIIQRRWRALCAMKLQRNEFLRQRDAAITLQRAYRRRAQRASGAKRLAAAIVIQKTWRGFTARTGLREELDKLEKLAELRVANGITSRTIADIIHENIETLLMEKIYGIQIEKLSTLSLLCMYSPSICEFAAFCRPVSAVAAVVTLLSGLNRSVPAMEVAFYGTKALLTLCKYDKTISAVWEDGKSCYLYLHLMKNGLSNCDTVFLNCVTILWHFAHNHSWAKIIQEEPTFKRTVESCAKKLKSMKTNTVVPQTLPSVKPNWGGLNKHARPSAFTDTVFGFRALCSILKLNVMI